MSKSADKNDQTPFEVFYDEQCPLCRKEINFIRRRDKQGRLKLVDISSPEFDGSSTGKSLDELMREIHGRYGDGSLITGVEVFREIYKRIGLGMFVVPTRLPVVRWAMDKAYNVFASLRYKAAMKRAAKQSCPLPSTRTLGSNPEN
jgi:predicted DCC family thiol-disulfide oxidoreductase YuxK